MDETVLLDRSDDAAALLDETRRAILHRLVRRPDSAAGVARVLGLPRQRVAYHVKELERRGFLEHVEDRMKGNCVERVLRATARSWVIAPQALGELETLPEAIRDRFSSSYLVAVAARTIRDVAVLRRMADEEEKLLATLSLEADVCFRSAADRDAFAQELTATVARLAQRHHDPDAEGGRTYRFVVGAYPAPPREEPVPHHQETSDE